MTKAEIHSLYEENFRKKEKIFNGIYGKHIKEWYAKFGALNKKNYKNCYVEFRKKLFKRRAWKNLLIEEFNLNKISRLLNKQMERGYGKIL